MTMPVVNRFLIGAPSVGPPSRLDAHRPHALPDVRKLRVGIPMGAVVQGVPRQQEHLRPGRQLLHQRVPVFEAAHVPLNYPVDDLTCQIAV